MYSARCYKGYKDLKKDIASLSKNSLSKREKKIYM